MAYDPRTHTTAKQEGPRLTNYPFAGNPVSIDQFARVHTRTMRILPDSYYPLSVGGYAPGPRTFTNYGFYSEDKSNAYWDVSTGITSVIANTSRNPYDGLSTMDTIVSNSSSSGHYHGRSAVTIGSGQTNCYSEIVKGGSSQYVQLFQSDLGSNYFFANFDLTAGTVSQACSGAGAASTFDSGITLIPTYFGTYYRIWISGKVNASLTSVAFGVAFLQSGTGVIAPVYTGTGATLPIGMSQFERNVAVPGPVIATTSAAVSISSNVPETFETYGACDPFAYLVDESPLSMSGGLASFTRTYARIPAPQTNPGSRNFVRPVMHGIKSGTTYAVSFDDLQAFSWIFTSRVTSGVSLNAPPTPTKTISGTVDRAGTYDSSGTNPRTGKAYTPDAFTGSDSVYIVGGSGTYTATMNTLSPSDVTTLQTNTGLSGVAISNDGSTANISWTGGTFKGAYTNTGYAKYQIGTNLLIITRRQTNDYNLSSDAPDISEAADLTDTHAITESYTPPGSVRTINATSHGGVAGDKVALWNGDKLIKTSVVVAVNSANQFTIPLEDLPGADAVITAVAMSSDAAACYANGPKVCTVREVTTFYLPGVSTGITTYADIPTQTTYLDPVSWLGRIVAASTWAAVEVSDVSQWLGPILKQSVTEIQMDDALDSVTP